MVLQYTSPWRKPMSGKRLRAGIFSPAMRQLCWVKIRRQAAATPRQRAIELVQATCLTGISPCVRTRSPNGAGLVLSLWPMSSASSRHQALLALWTVIMLASCLGGCGTEGGKRLPITGRITGLGAEAFDGSISFIPSKGNDGLGATAALKDGSYRFDRTNGPTAGQYEVSIRRTPDKAAVRSARGQSKQEWTFHSEIPADGPYTRDFQLD